MKPRAPVEAAATRPVLCGTDLSLDSDPTLQVAGALARRLGRRLLLAHAIDAGIGGPTDPKLAAWLEGSRRRLLHEVAARARRTGATVDERVALGRPADVLVELARRERVRLIVVGANSRPGTGAWFVGSVAERTAQRAAHPTLVVRAAAPLLDWAAGRKPLRVFICCDFTPSADAALRWVMELRELGPIEIVVGHVDRPVEAWHRFDGTGPVPFEANTAIVQATLERNVRTRAAAVLGELPFRVRVEPVLTNVAASLSALARREEADLVITGSHQYRGFERLWHGSVSRGLLHQAEGNVVVVPVSHAPTRRPAAVRPPRRILVPTDFSPRANAAIARACSLLPEGGTLHLLHVHPEPAALGTGSPRRRVRAATERALHTSSEQLRELVPVAAAAGGITTRVEVVAGRNVADEIARAAERLDVDAICLATQGRTGLAGAVLGSVAQGLMRLGRRPLFLVRDEAP